MNSSRKRLPLLLSWLLLFAYSLPAVAQTLPTVVSTGDGDTLRINQNGKRLTIRLGCIDAPERSQRPWGTSATMRLKALLPPGQSVRVRQIDRDRYGRTVAELYSGNQSVNLQLVREGFAVVYPQYLSGCAATKDQYLSAEATAKRQGLGVWHPQNRMTVMPWEYRKQRRSR